MSNRITCITKEDRHNPYERITHVGYTSSQGSGTLTQKQVIDYIEGGYHFFVEQGGKAVDVIVALSPHGNKYIKTKADGREPNNLLSLMECY